MDENTTVPVDDMLDQLESRQLIFTVTTGRSGTQLLSEMMGGLPGLSAFHEPDPDFSSVMRMVQHYPNLALRWLINYKLPQIYQEEKPYIETSHLFCKGFVEPFLYLGLVPDLILLHRDHRKVATSLYQLKSIPGRTTMAAGWYLAPDDPGTLILPDWRQRHGYQLCYWYCLEIERRRGMYQSLIRRQGGKAVSIKLSELTTKPGFSTVLKQLGLAVPEEESFWKKFEQLANTRVNDRDESKKARDYEPLSTPKKQELEDEVEDLVGQPDPQEAQERFDLLDVKNLV